MDILIKKALYLLSLKSSFHFTLTHELSVASVKNIVIFEKTRQFWFVFYKIQSKYLFYFNFEHPIHDIQMFNTWRWSFKIKYQKVIVEGDDDVGDNQSRVGFNPLNRGWKHHEKSNGSFFSLTVTSQQVQNSYLERSSFNVGQSSSKIQLKRWQKSTLIWP